MYLEKTDESCFQDDKEVISSGWKSSEFSVVSSFTDHDGPIDNLMEYVVETV